ncbi:MAG: hypothetical protein WBB85_12430, partial [Albidovulum sp.]
RPEPLLLTLLARHSRPQDVHYQWWTLINTLYGPSEQSGRTLTYVLLALLINLPGNSLLGGGGGILLLAGMSRLFSPLATLATVAIAVAPVPILVYLMGEGHPLPGF